MVKCRVPEPSGPWLALSQKDLVNPAYTPIHQDHCPFPHFRHLLWGLFATLPVRLLHTNSKISQLYFGFCNPYHPDVSAPVFPFSSQLSFKLIASAAGHLNGHTLSWFRFFSHQHQANIILEKMQILCVVSRSYNSVSERALIAHHLNFIARTYVYIC